MKKYNLYYTLGLIFSFVGIATVFFGLGYEFANFENPPPLADILWLIGLIICGVGELFLYLARNQSKKFTFYKMHGIGNDYIYFDCMESELKNPEETSIRLSDRHKGVGGDGIVMICKSSVADAKMRMFNADGSEGKMCGNAIRCVGKFLYDFRKTRKTTVTIETLSGIKTLYLNVENKKVVSVKVDMGAPILIPEQIPVALDGEKIVAREVEINGQKEEITCVSMGNPHCILFKDPETLDLEKIGPAYENAPIFPERVNTEFVKVLDKNVLQMRVWERGSGETWACGTGACAVAVAAVLNGYADKNTDITVKLRGGDLTIRWTDETVYMTGTATLVFKGQIEE